MNLVANPKPKLPVEMSEGAQVYNKLRKEFKMMHVANSSII